MRIIDLHCDVLYQLSSREHPTDFRTDDTLQCGFVHLQKAQAKAQVFAIFIDEVIPVKERYMEALRQIELFQTQVLAQPEMVHITEWQQLSTLEDGQIGAILSLEGCDAIGTDLHKLKTLLNAGVKLVGLTWNYENAVAFGAQEDPTKGLTDFGKEVVACLNDHDIIIDVSHLNMQGFWDVLPLAKHLIASHSNARTVCEHVRNLTDEQATALVKHGGHIHVVYNPPFIVEHGLNNVMLDDVVKHFRYLADLVGVEHLGLGSDFDGIEQTVNNLHHIGDTPQLLTALKEAFTVEEIEGIAAGNFERYVQAF